MMVIGFFMFILPQIGKSGLLSEETVKYIQDNKFVIGLGIYVVLTFLSSNLTYTGAFEVDVDGQFVWSRLSTRTLPSLETFVEEFVKVGISKLTKN